MGVHLLFLFLFQSGLAFAFSYFIARVLLGGSEDAEGRERMLKGIRRIQWITAGVAVVLVPAMFFAYFKSLPEGQPVSLAVWPAVWMLMILLAIILALGLASRKSRHHA